MTAAVHPVGLDVVRMRDRLERVAWMPQLTTALLAALVPRAFEFLFQPIAGGRFPTVPAVLHQLIL